MKYFLDTEFIERGPKHPIELISIGIVSEYGDTFYAISNEFDPAHASQWVKENVLAALEPPEVLRRNSPREIAMMVYAFVAPSMVGGGKPEFWGYYADYDWVVFAQMFGTMMDLPKGWPMYCRDLKQWCDQLGNPPLPPQGKDEHNALADARWNRDVCVFLSNYGTRRDASPTAPVLEDGAK